MPHSESFGESRDFGPSDHATPLLQVDSPKSLSLSPSFQLHSHGLPAWASFSSVKTQLKCGAPMSTWSIAHQS